MATSLHLVLENFLWRVESITPTETRVAPPRYRRYDPLVTDLPDGSGGMRWCWVEWASSQADSDMDRGATSMTQREAVHLIRLHVEYPAIAPYLSLARQVLLDRHDLLKTLRDPATRLGYDDSHTTTDIGLMVRTRTRDVLDKDTDTRYRQWRYTSEWACAIRESEI